MSCKREEIAAVDGLVPKSLGNSSQQSIVVYVCCLTLTEWATWKVNHTASYNGMRCAQLPRVQSLSAYPESRSSHNVSRSVAMSIPLLYTEALLTLHRMTCTPILSVAADPFRKSQPIPSSTNSIPKRHVKLQARYDVAENHG